MNKKQKAPKKNKSAENPEDTEDDVQKVWNSALTKEDCLDDQFSRGINLNDLICRMSQ